MFLQGTLNPCHSRKTALDISQIYPLDLARYGTMTWVILMDISDKIG